MNLVINLGSSIIFLDLITLIFLHGKKGNRRRKYRNRKNREKKLHGKDQQLKEYNGAGKLVEDHISVRIEEEKGSYIFLYVYTIHNNVHPICQYPNNNIDYHVFRKRLRNL